MRNFEKNTRSTERRSYGEQQELTARKGKRNRTVRGGAEPWIDSLINPGLKLALNPQ